MFVSPERGRGTVKLWRYRAAHAVNIRKSPIRADRALRSAHLRHAECALYLRLSFVFIIHALEALYDLNNYDC